MDKILDFNTESEYEKYMSTVNGKIEKNEQLTSLEILNFCFALPYENKKRFSFCDADRYEYLYLHKIDEINTSPALNEEQKSDFNAFLKSWKEFRESINHKNVREKYLDEEFNTEINYLKLLQKEGKIPTESEFENRLNEIIAYNKLIHIKGERILSDYKFPIELKLDGREIFINEYFFYHSLIRHYGQITRQLPLKKSYFSEDILIEELIQKVIEFLTILNECSTKIENIISIVFKYKTIFYQLYTKKSVDKSGKSKYRVNSFFPVEDPRRLHEIQNEYEEIPISKELFFIKSK